MSGAHFDTRTLRNNDDGSWTIELCSGVPEQYPLRSHGDRQTREGNGFRTFWVAIAIFASLYAVILLGSPASAQTLDATDRGWYRSDGFHEAVSENYVVGDPSGAGAFVYRNWFLFAIPAPDPGNLYTAATLRVFNPEAVEGTGNGFQSVNDFEFYVLVEYAGSLSDLVADSGNGNGAAIYDDLGTGLLFGGGLITDADNGQYVEFSLPLQALAGINVAAGQPMPAGGNFAFGGSLSTLDAVNNTEFAFGFSHTGSPPTQLVLTQGPSGVASAPEPDALALSVAGGVTGLLMGFLARRRRG